MLLVVGIHFVSFWYDPPRLSGRKTLSIYLSLILSELVWTSSSSKKQTYRRYIPSTVPPKKNQQQPKTPTQKTPTKHLHEKTLLFKLVLLGAGLQIHSAWFCQWNTSQHCFTTCDRSLQHVGPTLDNHTVVNITERAPGAIADTNQTILSIISVHEAL